MITLIGVWWYCFPLVSHFEFVESDLELCNSALHPSSGLIRSESVGFTQVKYEGGLLLLSPSLFSILSFKFFTE